MRVLRELGEATEAVRLAHRAGGTTGLVPTMGALHRGHESLIRQSLLGCDHTFVSIFVNPTQFGPGEDLDRYPRTLQDDLGLCESLGVRGVFVPTADAMYPAGATTTIDPPDVATSLEGERRPGHFAGVCTVVMKLFQILPTTAAFFGKKDYQQLAVIAAMVRDLNLPVRVLGGETVRDPDSLALSSRNRYLSEEQRRTALAIPRTLNDVSTRWRTGHRDFAALEGSMAEPLDALEVEYAVIRDAETLDRPVAGRTAVALIAARVGETRLIDNVELFD